MNAAAGATRETSVLESPRLRLRHVGEEDAPFILALLNDPGWLRYIGDRGVRTLADARRYIAEGPRKMYADHGFGLYLVERRSDDVPLGLCGLIRRDTLPDVDIGFALAEAFRGQGYALEAASATLRHAREVLKLKRVVAIAMPENLASTSLLERLGLRFERTIKFGPDAETLNYYGTSAAFALDAENVHAVDDTLWTSGQLSLADIERLPELGIEAVVNLALPTSSNAVPGEADAVHAARPAVRADSSAVGAAGTRAPATVLRRHGRLRGSQGVGALRQEHARLGLRVPVAPVATRRTRHAGPPPAGGGVGAEFHLARVHRHGPGATARRPVKTPGLRIAPLRLRSISRPSRSGRQPARPNLGRRC